MTINKNDTSDFLLLIPLIIISFLSTIDNFALQTAVDGGLILSEKVKYPQDFSNVTSIYYNGWTILHQLTSIMLRGNLSVIVISKILMFTSTIFYSFGIFYLVKGLTKSKIFALVISLIVIVTKISFGSVDYPALFFSEHTYGMFSLATFTLVVGLLFNGNFKLAGFFIILLASFHLVVGLWIIFLIIFLFFYLTKIQKQKDIYLFQEIKIGSYFAIIPIFISFVFFQLNTIDKSTLNPEDLKTYLEVWDHHRNIIDINYNYLIKTLFLIILYSYIFFSLLKNYTNQHFLFYFIFFNCIGSMIIYLLYKFFPYFFPDLVIRAMPTRVFLLHTVVGYPLIISFSYILLNNRLDFVHNTKKFFVFISILIIFVSIFLLYKYENRKYKSYRDLKSKIYYRIDKFKKNFSNSLNSADSKFWKKVENLNTDGYFVTTYNTSEPTLKFGKKPYIINAKFFDHLPYHPYTVHEVKLIIENIYGIDFKNPPIKFWPEIRDKWIKKEFETRSINQWQTLAQEFNLSGIIVPANWNLQIKKNFSSNKYTLYSF